MIEKREFVDKLEVLQDGQVQVRTATQFFENDIAVSEKSFHRKVIEPGADVAAEDELVRDVVSGNLHKKTRVDKFNERRNRQP